ncbi:hypothetical protein SAMN05518672_101670 [Chitinophaga sp. CF118]|uniref:hypothetical protein n=1 Tax=Chitinophaga sp. CF118 TaxID=1884367 RepID=UPI0008E045A9|nr:hypothetical protein [Chitinophaga sp. CF118]SFD13916.1 hypothetical protein SAMN05518672_101670 [Chitinophaga sp. CF118]
MPQFLDHVNQAKHNISFLENINSSNPAGYIDWQVTSCYYVAVRLINAHLANHDMQYRTHVDVKDAINPHSASSIRQGSALEQTEYLAYVKLQSLSRRSRYLVNEKDDNLNEQKVFLTYDVHFEKALRHLNTLIIYFNKKLGTRINPLKIKCSTIKKEELSFIAIQ